MFLRLMLNSMSIRYYLLFDTKTYFLCIILDYKNLKFKYLIDDIAINFLSSINFTSIEDLRRKCNPMVDLSKFHVNWVLFTIRSIKLLFLYNFRLQKLEF